MGNTVLMRGETVTAFTQELFQKAGMSEPDAKYHAECLVNTNYWGIDSHGVIRVPAYFKRMLNGAINTNPQIKVVRGEGCLEVLDVDAAAGFIGGRAGMERAMDHAAVSGIAACGVINSNHFGAGALYARMAASLPWQSRRRKIFLWTGQLIRTAVPPMIPRQPLTDICCPWADTRDWAYPMWWTYYPA